MKYDTLMPEDIEPYLNGRSWEDLKVGDEIAFPEPDDTITPESLVGRRIKVRWTKNEVYEGTIEGFDESTGKHQVTYDDGDKDSFDFKGDEEKKTYTDRFVVEGAEAYFDWRGVCIVRKLEEEESQLMYIPPLRFSRTHFLIPHFILFLSPCLPTRKVLSTRSCSPKACSP
jgi:hypothetical protein